MAEKNYKAKLVLQEMDGSLRESSLRCGLDYFRLSQYLNGWIRLRPDEIEKLKKHLGEETAKVVGLD